MEKIQHYLLSINKKIYSSISSFTAPPEITPSEKTLNIKNMPPISEKRSPPILGDNAKENLDSSQTLCDKLNGRMSSDMLELRGSWLQEIEMYKDQVRTQFLTQHNHLHTTEGCQYDGLKPTTDIAKKRSRTRSNSESNDKVKSSEDDELVLKRSRDEHYPAIIINNNRNQNHQLPPKQQPQQPTSIAKGLQPASPTGLEHSVENSSQSHLAVPLLTVLSTSSSSVPTNCKPTNDVKSCVENESNLCEKNSTNALSSDCCEHALETTTPNNPTNPKTDIPSVSNENEGSSDIEDEEEFDEFLQPDGVEYSDSDDEYTGHVYLNTSYCKLDSYTDATSLPSSETNYYTPSSPFSPSLFPNVPAYLTFASHAENGPTLPPELQKVLKWKLTSIMPKVVRRVVANTGFRLIKKTNEWVGTWDKHMKSPGFKMIRSYQKYNHLPGSFRIGRKDSVWRNLKAHMTKHGKREFGFMQRTYILPQDLVTLKTDWPKYSVQNTKWIIKPPASARGTGIKIVSRWNQIPKNIPLIVQKYIERPLLINGSKFDLRLYVIVTSVNPLRIYIHTDGLARFASVQYSDKLDTLDDRCMHLTNYSINKFSESYAINEDVNACQGHKWTLRSLWTHFREQGINTKKLWGKIRNVVLRTLLAGESALNRLFKQNVRSKYNCYELFGFDILLDEQLTPWLLEVNISPSLHSDQPLDLHVKGPLIQAVLNTAMYQVPSKLTKEQEQIIANQYNLPGKICVDKRLYTMHISAEETAKHNYFTSSDIEYREEYLDAILENLTPDDVRCLLLSEDEFARSSSLERIFPGPCSYEFLPYIDFPRYYNRLLDAWEHKYGSEREAGIRLLQDLCETGMHLKVPPRALKEPSIEPEIPSEPNSESSSPPPPSTINETVADTVIANDSTSEVPTENSVQNQIHPAVNGAINNCNDKPIAKDITLKQPKAILVETK